MATVDILVEGYVKKVAHGEQASSTVTLIRDKEMTILVDPGISREPLAAALHKLHLTAESINYVLVTHYHPDHAFGAAWFPQAKLIDATYVYDGDNITEHDGFVPGTELAIMRTPGHAHEHCALAVPTDAGMVVVAGDIFWWYLDENQDLDIHRVDPYAKDVTALQESRKKVLNLADIIIPGHGHPIKVK